MSEVRQWINTQEHLSPVLIATGAPLLVFKCIGTCMYTDLECKPKYVLHGRFHE